MPITADVRASVAKAALMTLFDGPPLIQAIVNVRVIPLVTAVRIRFETIYPCWATLEVFRMVHGEIDLDMEKDNLVRTEIELFGDASSRHNMIVRGLEQERRFWFRISVPRRSPAEPAATGQVRARGEFATLRRSVMVDIENIQIDNDSDDDSPGEIGFSNGIYDASRAGGPRLAPGRFRREESLPDGRTVEAPFGSALSIGKAPDALGIWVMGSEDDTWDIPKPGQGLGLVGMAPPDTLPEWMSATSTDDYDISDALGIVGTRQSAGRSTKPFSFSSVGGARLVFTVNGRLFQTADQTLGARITPPWKLITRMHTRMARDGRMACRLRTPAGRIRLALSPDGRLLRGDERRVAGWQELEAPAFGKLSLRLMDDSSCVLVGTGDDGAVHVARVRDVGREHPRWHSLLGAFGEPGMLAEDPQGAALVTLPGKDRQLWMARIFGDSEPDLQQVAHDIVGQPALGFDRQGGTMVLCSTASEILLVRGDPDGNRTERHPLGDERLTPLAVVEHEAEGPVAAALGAERQVLVFHAARGGSRWEDIGMLDDLLDGPFEKLSAPGFAAPADPPT
jgi:hypothetical protein